ncbi:MAG TPA: GntG family PLP-dependent aldolase [Vicinamibacteria bacterium]|nr:GntG family PLP-dependent aldolase [Vicinamibacteria bacterium]
MPPPVLIDLRSDTVTRPTPAMRRAMAEAEVGDDVYGEDPTVARLQDLVAARLGFEAALWVPTGVMANEIAIRILTRPGQEVLAEERSHVVQFELAGMAVLSGVMPRVVRAEDGHLTADDIRAARRPASYMRSDLGLVVLENTHNFAGGTVADAALMRAAIAAAHDAGVPVHVDGARLWNASVALGAPLASLVAGADTAMVTLSKGLCAPAGSVLVSSRARIEEARRVRKQLGGGMRQIGILAAAGLVGVETMVDRLAEDHVNAALLAEALAGCPGVRVRPARTNIVVAELAQRSAPDLAADLATRGILVSVMDARTMRLVTHRDVDGDACARATGVLVEVLA